VLFSTLHRHLLIVSGELWRALTQLVGVQQEHESIETVATNDELKLLEDLHFIISVDQNEKLFARYLINMAKYNTSIMSLFISFTSRCNFKCSYCYQDFRMSHPAQDLSLQKWQILFSFIRRRVLEFRISDLSIALFGGEPLLNLEVVGRACEDLKGIRKRRMPCIYYPNHQWGTAYPACLERVGSARRHRAGHTRWE